MEHVGTPRLEWTMEISCLCPVEGVAVESDSDSGVTQHHNRQNAHDIAMTA